MRPNIVFTDQSGRDHGLRLESLQRQVEAALPHVLSVQKEGSVLDQLDEVELTLVDDDSITRVHADFMDDPTPTDVITFHHGEILVSIDTAERQAAEFGKSWPQEVSLYLIHGLLHLAGYEDKSPKAFEEMAKQQEAILQEVL